MSEISAYVPQIRIRAFPYPLLACDIDDIPDTLIGWSDTSGDYDIHNMIYDIPYDGSKRAKRTIASSEQPPTTSENDDEDDESSPATGKEEDDEATPKESVTDAAEIPKWPIFSIIKYYPRSFDK